MGHFLLFILNCLSPFGALLVLVYFFISPRRGLLKKLREELRERFVLYPYTELLQNPIWIHCASVGEVNSMQGLIPQLKDLYNKPILITTNTWAGRTAAYKNPHVDNALLIPFDFYPLTRKFVRLVKPHRMMIVEGELWPNNIMACVNNGVPVYVINGRMSARSAKKYKYVYSLFSMLLKNVSFAALQSEEIKERYIGLGLRPEIAFAPGNVKYDSLKTNPPRTREVKELFTKFGWDGKTILVCGSTHIEEEALIMSAAPALYKENIRIVIAPRHLERKSAITESLTKNSIEFNLLSHDTGVRDPEIILADAMGWLTSFYAGADIAFVGGTIAKKGGHNLLEPAILAKPVVFGPYVYNTPDTAAALLENKGGESVSKENFAEVIIRLSKNKDVLASMSAAAAVTARSFQGATVKIMELITNHERNN
ncbi:3-deoxy-D-manno-octulosonic-acid transferase [Elusimicrobium simillimum]|uniref:3-deoxy-D-manno-octulosonic acid transferase n=1 Tax=Elusimicrobium simillimum TaxID=3143438 RepID=UPI003C6FE63C